MSQFDMDSMMSGSLYGLGNDNIKFWGIKMSHLSKTFQSLFIKNLMWRQIIWNRLNTVWTFSLWMWGEYKIFFHLLPRQHLAVFNWPLNNYFRENPSSCKIRFLSSQNKYFGGLCYTNWFWMALQKLQLLPKEANIAQSAYSYYESQ